MTKYLFRLDDACPTMHKYKWEKIEKIFDEYSVKPLVGIIPDNKDEKQICSEYDRNFWTTAKQWQNKDWCIALHGYNHVYHESETPGLNPLWNRSEFVGESLDVQREKIRKGLEILHNKGLEVEYFFAPSHTSDRNTLEALRLETEIRIISDTIATLPYRKYGFIFIPQIGSRPRVMPFDGVFTFCLHPSMMSDSDFERVENFLKEHHSEFVSFKDLDLNGAGPKSLFSRILSFVYFANRQLKGIK